MTDERSGAAFPDRERLPETGRLSRLHRFFSPWRQALKLSNGEDTVRETLEELIEERQQEETPISPHERLLLAKILRLRDVRTHDIMTPRADIVAVEQETPLNVAAERITAAGHSRMPVYRNTLDETVGTVHVRDLLTHYTHENVCTLTDLMNPDVKFVSPAMRVLDLLREMQIHRTHMALVVDEHGGIDGLVTIEVLVEQIVGEIEDEHDAEGQPDLVFHEDGTLEANARAHLSDFETLVGPVLTEEERRDEDIDTLGGLVSQMAGRIPSRGEIVRHETGINFWIMETDPRRIHRLMISRLPRHAGTADDNGEADETS